MFANSLARASRRRVLLAGLAAAAASAGVSAAAQDAQAAFTLKDCQGSSSVASQGASFQTNAQAFWRTVFTSSNACGGTPTPPSYKGNGSGNGLAAMGAGKGGAGSTGINCATVAPLCATPTAEGVRDLTTSMASTDEPPSAAQQAAINLGNAANAADDGVVHVIPAATGASTVVVNLPDGCNVTGVAAALKTNGADGVVGGATNDTGDTETNGTSRLRLPNATIEKIFAADTDADTWGEVAPGFTGACATTPIKRIVRQDESGTTYGFKAYLNLINPGRGWLATYVGPNTRWPAAGTLDPTAVAPTPITAPGACPNGGTNLCSSASSNATNLSVLVNNTDGSIGYADLATARANQFDITPAASQTAQTDDRYWMPLQNNPGGTTGGFVEPTVDPKAHTGSAGSRGAACSTAPIVGAPTPANSPKSDPTLGNWSTTAAAGGSSYPACVLTYVLAWDDNAPVYGNTAAEEAKARTVKDFLTKSVLSGFGQAFTAQDYSALPALLLSYSQTGVNAIDWNKSAQVNQPPAGSGSGPGPAPGPGPGPAPGPGPVKPAAPSNAFTPSSGKINSARTSLAYTVKLPGAGRLTAAATYKKGSKTAKIATVNATVNAAGTAKLTVKLSSAARSALRKKKKLAVSVKFTFTPTGGTARTITKSVTVRPAAKKKKSTKKSSKS